ncbi:MAG: DUF1700 domain-containing protein [Eubacteriales bacterium]
MNKQQYLSKLKTMLPANESEDILNDFEEHFRTGLENGKTEDEIIQSLGNPVDIAKEYGYTEDRISKMSVSTRVIALIGLIFFDLLIGISIIASLFAAWVSLWAVVLSLVAAGIAGLVGMFLTSFWYLGLCAGIASLALAVLMGIGMIYVSKYAFKALVWYGRLHVRVASGD